MSPTPIICLANAAEPHRFTVATVTADLICGSCGSNDLDLDEAALGAQAAKTAAEGAWGLYVTHKSGGHVNILPKARFADREEAVQAARIYGGNFRGNANISGVAVKQYPGSTPTTTVEEFRKDPSAFAGKTEAAKAASYETDPEMAEVHEVASVTQKVRCSTCLTEHTVTAADPAQPMPACPSCGAQTLSPGGDTLTGTAAKAVNEDTHEFKQNSYGTTCVRCGMDKPEKGDDWVPPCAVVQSGYSAARTAGADTGSLDAAFAAAYAAADALDATFAALTKTAEEESVCKNCGAEIRKAGPDEAWRHVGDTECTKAAPGERAPAFAASLEQRVEAKVAEIVAGVRATNPGMSVQAARRVALQTVHAYPQMIEGN